jgi:ATP-binding cassette subfamily B protein
MLVSSFAEVVSLAAVLPFLGILTSPDFVFHYPIIAEAALFLGITSAGQLVLPLTVVFASVALIAGGLRILLLWFGTRLSNACGAELSIEVYRRTLYQPYKAPILKWPF